MDVAHPDESMFQIPLLPNPAPPVHVWWFAFNQLRGLPEQLLAGRFRPMVDWLFDNLLINKAGLTEYDRDLYARAYSQPDAIRAGNAWYQAFYQDIEDRKGYGPVGAPMLGLGSEFNYDYLAYLLPASGTDVRVTKIANSGHFVAEEQPRAVTDALLGFLTGR